MAFLVIPTHASGIFNQIKLSLRFKIVFADTTLNLNKAEGNEAGLVHTHTTPLKKRNKKCLERGGSTTQQKGVNIIAAQ